MELTDILCILNLCGLVVVAVILIVVGRHKPTGRLDRETLTLISDMVEKNGRKTEERILSDMEREDTSLKADMLNEVRAGRTETVRTVRDSVTELGGALSRSQQTADEAQTRLVRSMNEGLQGQIRALTEAQDKQMAALLTAQNQRMDALLKSQNERMDAIAGQVGLLTEQSRTAQEAMRKSLDQQLSDMQRRNAEQLDKMRETVDEKLQKTLDERISQSFRTVSEQLSAVYQGLGEMKTLAGSVGDLKKVLSGVKTRGILGEIQLGSIIEDMLSPDQYEKNVVTVPGTRNPVEYAVCLPGDGDGKVYLPIDSKFPGDTYQHLLDAYDACDAEAVKEAQNALITILKKEAKDICDKYVAPPHTTNFGVMFLPTEGLYAEAVRLGLAETLRQECRITVSGPTTLSALLNSLQMGFRTLAIQKRSGEVWQVLGAVKTEFGRFGDALAAAQSRIEQTGDELEKLVGVRTRQINRKLKSVAELPADESELLIGTEDGTADT